MPSILIVDDEALMRALLEQTLEELEDDFDVEIHTAADGGAGLAAAKQYQPDLILLDIMMPVMNGLDVCAALREDEHLSNSTVVLLTARGQEADRQEGLARGANHYITKPFDPDEILTLAKDVLAL